MKLENRFLKYISFDTQSDPASKTTPSTSKQLKLADFLSQEMKILGMNKVVLDEHGIVYGVIPGNTQGMGERVGFIAHMDTSPDASGKDIDPQIIRNYTGGDILLNEEKRMVLSPKDSPVLDELIHHDLITTDGNTLLGADDKAGIAIIMTMAEYLHKNPSFKHNDILVAFTPDEEIGRGTDFFDLTQFDADYAYTIDGGDIREYNDENFNAFAVTVTITGKSYHPGSAKNRMVNALTVARDFDFMLGDISRPEHTEDREGFYHLCNVTGDVSEVTMDYIVRDHDLMKIHQLMDHMSDCSDFLNKKYYNNCVMITFTKQYENMHSILQKSPQISDTIRQAMERVGLTPRKVPVRGGTDGAMLSFKGLPCPNIGTGGYNYHGPYEFVSITSMNKGVELLLCMIKIITERNMSVSNK